MAADATTPAPLAATPDPELEAALKAVLQVIHKERPLKANQILQLAAELQRLGVHRLVEEHLRKFQHRSDAKA